MKQFYSLYAYIKFKLTIVIIAMVLFLSAIQLKAQYTSIPPFSTTTIPAGSYYIDMGITPQTVANGLKPYGLLYALLVNKTPVIWSISNNKVKDGIDIPAVPTATGTKTLRGGPFIVLAQYRTAAVNTLISTWTGLGVIGYTSTADVPNVPVYVSSLNQPKWTMDAQNGGIATSFFANAGIPAAAYGGASSNWKIPAALDCCDDIFVMPHADPKWLTHSNLYFWNATCNGAIWLGCHAGSALMNMYNPADTSQQTNFLTTKINNTPITAGITLPVFGSTAYSQNSLILWGAHNDGVVPYLTNTGTLPVNGGGTLANASDPVSQFMGTPDLAQQNGSEQMYIPVNGQGWLTSTNIITWDPDQSNIGTPPPLSQGPAVTIAYGPGLGNTARGNVMLEASHNISGTAPANVAAQRAFFNFSFLASYLKSVLPSLNGLPLDGKLNSGQGYPLSVSIPTGSISTYTITWSDNGCGGTFTPSAGPALGLASVTYTPPLATTPKSCLISVVIEDPCHRITFETKAVTVQCVLGLTSSITQPACFGASTGKIDVTVTGATGPYTYNWARVSPAGTGSGSSSSATFSITALSAGTYNVTVSAASGCSGTLSANLTEPPLLTATNAVTNILCNGGTGSINLTAAGGTSPYTYLWTGGATTEDRAGLVAGTYTVTVTDSKSCKATATSTITQPAAALSVSGIVTGISCFGGSNGSINITPTGGTPAYTYLWSNGATTEDVSGLAVGAYSILVTDANGCFVNASYSITQPPVLNATVVKVDPDCINTPPSYNGSITVTPSGGTPVYTYLWNDANTSATRTGLGPGIYTVTITDSKGCTKVITITLTGQNTTPGQPSIIIKG